MKILLKIDQEKSKEGNHTGEYKLIDEDGEEKHRDDITYFENNDNVINCQYMNGNKETFVVDDTLAKLMDEAESNRTIKYSYGNDSFISVVKESEIEIKSF